MGTQVIPGILFGYPLPTRVYMTVDGVKVEFLSVDTLPSQVHSAFGVKIVQLSVDTLPACQTVSVRVEIIDIAVNGLEFVLAVGAVFIAVFDAARSLDESGCVRVPFGKSGCRIARRYRCRCRLHFGGDMIIQRVVELIRYRVDDVAAAVLDIGRHRTHVSLAGNADMPGLDGKSEHAVVSCAVNIAGILEVVDRRLHPSAAKGRGTVSEPVVIGKRGVHFFDKCSRITGISAVVVELENIGADVNPARHKLILDFTLDIAAGEVGNRSGSNFCDQRVIVDITGIIRVAVVGASPEDFDRGFSDFEGGAFLEVDDLTAVFFGRIHYIVIPVQKVLAIACGLSAPFHVSGIGKIDRAYVESGIIDDRRDLIHMVIMIVGEINIEVIEVMVVQIIDQCVVLISDISVHQKVLAAAGKHCAVAPDTGVSEIDGRDLHISARRFCGNDRCDR